MRAGGLVLSTLAIACVGELPLDGLSCPCVDGWVCDTATNTCVQTPAGSGGTTSQGGGGAGGTGGMGGSVTPGVIVVANLRADWTTPNTILWRWDPSEDNSPDQLNAYEMVVGESEGDVAGRTGTARIFTVDENPELGRYLLPNTGAGDVVAKTITDGHDPDTNYFAQLTAIDTASNTTTSNVAQGRTTLAASAEIVLFSEDPIGGFPLPSTFVRTAGCGYQSDQCLQWVNDACDTTEECWENLRRQGLNIDANAISQGSFSTTAFIELAVANGSSFPGFWSETWMSVGGAFFAFNAWTIRSGGEYRVYQFPLRILTDGGVALDRDTLVAGGIEGFRVGTSWEGAATIRVDEVRIRW